MPVKCRRSPLVARLSLLLLMGVAGCATGQIEEPLVPGVPLEGLAAESGEASVTRLVRMAKRSLASGDARTAQGLLEQALIQDPEDREAALTLGHAHLAAGMPQEAGEAFGRILLRDPADREAGVGYARAMIGIGRSEAALEHLEPLIRRRVDDIEAMNLAGVAFDLEGEHDKAVELYRQGLAVAPDARDLSSNLGLSLALGGRHDEALAILRPLAEGYGSSPRHRQNLAFALGLAGQFDAAERWSRMDLAEADVANNLSFFRLVRGLAPGTVRSAALQPDMARPLLEPVPAPARLAEPATAAAPVKAQPASTQPASAPPVAAQPVIDDPVAAPADQSRLEAAPSLAELVPLPGELARAAAAVGEAPVGEPAGPAAAAPLPAAAAVLPLASPSPGAPQRRLPSALRPKVGFVAGDAAVTGVGVEVASVGSWFVDLGPLPDPAWRAVKDRHQASTAGLYRLAPGVDPAAPLVVGPFDTAAAAGELCRAIGDAVASCRPVRL